MALLRRCNGVGAHLRTVTRSRRRERGRLGRMRNTITDVPGITVGQAERVGDGWLTGVTVVVPPPGGAVAGVDVRGGGPGTRETDLLDPRNVVDRVHAVVLTGGSALGLCAVDGVVQRLLAAGHRLPGRACAPTRSCRSCRRR